MASSEIEGDRIMPNREAGLKNTLQEYVLLSFGSLCLALALNWFLIPNQIASGGISGIANIIFHVTGIPVWMSLLAINVPVFIIGTMILGSKTGIKSFIGLVLVSVFIFATDWVDPLTDNLLLAALYGGLLVGVGLGFVFRARASTGGTDLIAQVVHKYTGLSLGICMLFIDGMVIVTAAIVFGAEFGLMALLSLYVTSKTIDLVQEGFSFEKFALIISEKSEDLQQAILVDLDRGVTKLHAQGGFTGIDRPILMCVVEQKEVSALKKMVKEVDPDAFVIIAPAQEVLGRGFRGVKKIT
nr:YitT family protein [Desulfuribacillus stibiiarsenatis]